MKRDKPNPPHIATIAVSIVLYRVDRYAYVLGDLKEAVKYYLVYDDEPMPVILRAFALDEMERDTPYQKPKVRASDPNIDIMMRNKHVGHLVAGRPAGMPLRSSAKNPDGAYDMIADANDLTGDQVAEFYKKDRKRNKKVLAEWHNILDPLPEAEREEILNGIEPYMRDMLYPS